MISKPGYTLIELVTVLLLISVLMMLVLPSDQTTSRTLSLRTELETMYTLITYLYQCALATATDQELSFDVVNHRYTYHGVTRALDKNVQFGFVPGTQGPPADPVYTLTTPVTFNNQKIVCSADGSLSAGVCYFTDKEQQAMFALSIPVGSTGIRKYRFDKRWVLLP